VYQIICSSLLIADFSILWHFFLKNLRTFKSIHLFASHFISSGCKGCVRDRSLRYKRDYRRVLISDSLSSENVTTKKGKPPHRQVSHSAKFSLACNSQLRYGCLGFDKTAFCGECGNVLYTVSLWLHLCVIIEPSMWNWIIKQQAAADWKVVQCLIFLLPYSEINTRRHSNVGTWCSNLLVNVPGDL